jgi:hypothetical protein
LGLNSGLGNRLRIAAAIRGVPCKNLQNNGKAVLLEALESPRGFQEVKVPRFHDNGTGWW